MLTSIIKNSGLTGRGEEWENTGPEPPFLTYTGAFYLTFYLFLHFLIHSVVTVVNRRAVVAVGVADTTLLIWVSLLARAFVFTHTAMQWLILRLFSFTCISLCSLKR